MRIVLKRGSLALALGLLLASPAHGQAPAPEDAPLPAIESDMLVLEVRVDGRRVAEAIPAYQSGDDVLLPLGQLAQLLTLAITTQPDQGTASGYIVDPARVFGLDAARATVTLKGSSREFDRNRLQVHPDDIYVATGLLARWLPLDLQVDMSRLSLAVRPLEPLPLQLRLEREARAAAAGTPVDAPAPDYPLQSIPYRWLRPPFTDQTLSLDYRGGDGEAALQGRYTGYATADVLGLQGALYVNTGTHQAPSDVRLTLGRHDPDAGLLGPLRARTALVGSIPVPAVENVTRSSVGGDGVMLSNRPLTRPDSFGQHSLEGPLPPGWDVELYFNDVLIGFQSGGPDGRYHFDDLQLLFGTNEFRLVFHGPLGEVRVESETFLLEQSITRPGEFYYSVAHQRDADGYDRSMAQLDWGLTEHLAAAAGVVTAPVQGETRRYANLALRGHWRAMILGGEWVRAADGGSLLETSLRTRLGGWSVHAAQAWLDDFSSEVFLPGGDPVRTRQRLRLDGSIDLPFMASRLPATLQGSHEVRESGADHLDIAARLAAHVRGTAVTGQLRWQSLGALERADATLQLSRRIGGLGVRSQLNYTIEPEQRLSAVTLSADRRLGEGYLQSFGVTRLFDSSETLYSAGLTKSLGSYGLGITAGYSSRGEVTAGLRLFVAMGHEPRRGDWHFDALPMTSTGAVSALAFLDANLNGRHDPGEPPIPGVEFEVDGGRHPTATDEHGIAYLERLPAQRHTRIALVTESLEDPQRMPRVQGLQVVPRPGAVAELDFPVIATSEVEGTLSMADGSSPGALPVELVDAHGQVVATATSFPDGYYVVTGVPAGRYTLRVAADRLAARELGQSPRAVVVEPDEWLVSGIDLMLAPVDAGARTPPPSAAPVEPGPDRRTLPEPPAASSPLQQVGEAVPATASEIQGTLTVAGGRSPGVVRVEVVDGAGRVVASGASFGDGYYILTGVPAGRFTVRVAAAELALRGLRQSPREVTVEPGDWLVSGVDLVLTPGRGNE